MRKNNKKNKSKNKNSFLSSVISELKLVTWSEPKNIIKYSLATIVFCLILSGYFAILNLALSFIKEMFL